LLKRIAIGRAMAFWILIDQLPVLVSGYLDPVLPNQASDGLRWPERPRDVIAEINNAIYVPRPEVVHDPFESCNVSMDI
jgi:hypothetical protein